MQQNKELVILAIQLIVAICTVLFSKCIKPMIPADNIESITAKIALIVDYADKFVKYAKYFMSNKSGSEKMEEVVKQLSVIAEKYDINISETEIRAIAQTAYDSMKAADDERENKKLNNILESAIVIPKAEEGFIENKVNTVLF